MLSGPGLVLYKRTSVTISGSNTRQQILLGTFFCSAHWPACGRDLNAAIRISLWLRHKLVNSYSEDATYSVYINGEHKRMTASAMIISNRLIFKSQPHQVRVSLHSFKNTHTDIFYLKLYGIIDNEQSRTSLG